MRETDYIIALILTLCCLFSLISVNMTRTCVILSQEIKNEIRGNFDALNAGQHNTSEIIQKVDELTRENERLRMENTALRDMIEAFDIRQEQKYDFAGHQSRYMEGVR